MVVQVKYVKAVSKKTGNNKNIDKKLKQYYAKLQSDNRKVRGVRRGSLHN